MVFGFLRHQGTDDIVSIKRKGKANVLHFSDTDTMVSSNQTHLNDLNLNFIFIHLKE